MRISGHAMPEGKQGAPPGLPLTLAFRAYLRVDARTQRADGFFRALHADLFWAEEIVHQDFLVGYRAGSGDGAPFRRAGGSPRAVFATQMKKLFLAGFAAYTFVGDVNGTGIRTNQHGVAYNVIRADQHRLAVDEKFVAGCGHRDLNQIFIARIERRRDGFFHPFVFFLLDIRRDDGMLVNRSLGMTNQR